MKKLLIVFLTLLLLTGCGKTSTKIDKNKISQEELATLLNGKSYEEAVTFLMENHIEYIYNPSPSDSVPEDYVISLEFIEDKIYLNVSSGRRELFVPSYLGSERGLVEQWVQDLDQKFSVYDYEFVFDEGCETDYNCVVSNQSIVHQLIKTETTVVYTFSHR